MTSHETIRDARDYINYAFHISARGAAEVTSDIMGMSNNIQYMLGQLAWKTSEYLGQAEGTAISMATAAIGAFAAATESAAKYEQAIASVEAISGRQVSKELVSEKAIQMSNQFGMSVEQMTGGLESLARAGVTANQSIEALLESSVQMSKFEGRDLEESINSLLSTTNLLNPDLDVNSDEFAKTVKELNQQIISTSESSPINAKNIMDTLQHVGGYASAASLDQEDLFATIAQLGAKGTKGEIAGTSLRAFVSAGQKDTAQRALEKIGLNVSDLWDESGQAMLPISEMKQVLDDALKANGYSKQQRLEFYSDFVGYKQANQIMKIDTKEVDKYKDKISNAMSLTDKMGIILGTTQGNWQQLVETTRNFMLQVGQHVLKFLNPIVWGVKIIAKVLSAIPGSTQLAAIGLGLVAIKGVAVTINILLPTLLSFLNKFSDTSLNLKTFFSQLRSDLEKSKEIITSLGDSAKMNQIVNQREQEIGEKKLQKDYEELALQEYFRATQGYIGHYMKGNVIYDAQTNQEVAEEYVTDRGEKKYRALRDFGSVHQGDVTDDYTSFGINLFRERTSNWDLYSKEKKDLVRNQERPEQKFLDPIIEYLKTRDLAEAHADSKKVKESAQLNGGPVFAFGEDGGISLGNIISSIDGGVSASAFDAEMDYMNKILKNIEKYARKLRDISEREEQYRERVRSENARRRQGPEGSGAPEGDIPPHRNVNWFGGKDVIKPKEIIIENPKIINTQKTRSINPEDSQSGTSFSIFGGGRKRYVRKSDTNLENNVVKNVDDIFAPDFYPGSATKPEHVRALFRNFFKAGKLMPEDFGWNPVGSFGVSQYGTGVGLNIPNIIGHYSNAADISQQIQRTLNHEILHQVDTGGSIDKKQDINTYAKYGGYVNSSDNQNTIIREYNARLAELYTAPKDVMHGTKYSANKNADIKNFSIMTGREAAIKKLKGEDYADISINTINTAIGEMEAYKLSELQAVQELISEDNEANLLKAYDNFVDAASGTEITPVSKSEYLSKIGELRQQVAKEIEALEMSMENLETLRKHGADINKIMDDANLSQITQKTISDSFTKKQRHTLTPYNYSAAESAQAAQEGMNYIKKKIETYTGDNGREAIKQDMIKAIHPSGYSEKSMQVGIEMADWAMHDFLNYTGKQKTDVHKTKNGNLLDKDGNELLFTDEVWYDDAFTNTNRRAMKASDFMGGDFTTERFKYGQGKNAWGRKFIDSQGNTRYVQIGQGKNLKIIPKEDLEYDEDGYIKNKNYENAMFTEEEKKYYSDRNRTEQVNLADYSDELATEEKEVGINQAAGMFPNGTFDYIGKDLLDHRASLYTNAIDINSGAAKDSSGRPMPITLKNTRQYDSAMLKTMYNAVDSQTGNIMRVDENGNVTDEVQYYFDPYTQSYNKYTHKDLNEEDLARIPNKYVFDESFLTAEENKHRYKQDALGNYQNSTGNMVFYKTGVEGKFVGRPPDAQNVPVKDIIGAVKKGGVRTPEAAKKVYQQELTQGEQAHVMSQMSETWRSRAGRALFNKKDNLNRILRNIGRKDDFIAIKNIMKSDYGADLSNFSQRYGDSEEQIKDIVTWVEESLETAEEKEEAIGKFVDVLMKHEDTTAKTLEAVNFNPAGKSHMNTAKGFSEYLTQNIVDGGENKYGGYQGSRSAAAIMQDYGFNPEDASDIFNIQGAGSGYGYFIQMRENLMKNVQQRLGRELNEAEIKQVDELLDELTKEYFAPEMIPDLGTMGTYNPKVAYEGVRAHANAAGIPIVEDETTINSEGRRRRRRRQEEDENEEQDTGTGERQQNNEFSSDISSGRQVVNGKVFDIFDIQQEHFNIMDEMEQKKAQFGFAPNIETMYYEKELNKKRAEETDAPQNRLNKYASQLSPTMIDIEMQKTSAAIKQHGLNIISALAPLTEGLERTSGLLNRIAQTFPILAPVAGVFNTITDTVGGFTDGIMSVLGFFDSMAHFKTKLPESWQKMLGGIVSKINTIPLFNQMKLRILKGGEKVLGGVDKIVDKVASFIAAHPAIAAAVGVLVATIGVALLASKKYHDKQIKEINEEKKHLKAEKKAAKATYYSSAQTLKGGGGKPWERETSKINFETAANKLEGIVAKEQLLIQKQYSANQSIWGEYGFVNQMKMAFEWTGMVEADHYGDKHETTSKSIRDIHENTMRDDAYEAYASLNPMLMAGKTAGESILNLEDNEAAKQVSMFYKVNEKQFAKMEYYEDELNSLYNTETSLVHKYGSLEAARGSAEWQQQVQQTAAQTGSSEQEVEKYLDWMQTEWVTQQATEQMQGKADQIKGQVETQAYLMQYGRYDEAMNFQKMDKDDQMKLMVEAQAKEITNKLKMDLFWTGVMMDLMGILQFGIAILNAMLLPFKIIVEFLSNWANKGFWSAMDGIGDTVNDAKDKFYDAAGSVEAGGTYIGSASKLEAKAIQEGVELQKDDMNRRNNPNYGMYDLSSKYFDLGNKQAASKINGAAINNQSLTTNTQNNQATTNNTKSNVNSGQEQPKSNNNKSEDNRNKTEQEEDKSLLDSAKAFVPDYGVGSWLHDYWGDRNENDVLFEKDEGENNAKQQQKEQKIAETLQNNEITIENININTEDDPEKIKTALMNLIIELQKDTANNAVSNIFNAIKNATGNSTNTNSNNNNGTGTGG